MSMKMKRKLFSAAFVGFLTLAGFAFAPIFAPTAHATSSNGYCDANSEAGGLFGGYTNYVYCAVNGIVASKDYANRLNGVILSQVKEQAGIACTNAGGTSWTWDSGQPVGLGSSSLTGTYNCPLAPPSPSLAAAASPLCSSGQANLTITSQSVSGIDHYTLYVYVGGGSTPFDSKTVTPSATGVTPVSYAATPGALYSFAVSASDAFGNQSVLSPQVTLQTTSDCSCAGSAGTITSSGGPVSWTAAASGGAASYSYAWTDSDGHSSGASSAANGTVSFNYTSGGTKTATVTITSGAETGVRSCSLTLPPLDYSISASSGSVTVSQGGTGTVTVSKALTSGITGSVSLGLSGVPAGVSATFDASAACSPTCSSLLTLSVSPTATPGTYPITVSGLSTDATPSDNSVTFNLTVTNPYEPLTVAKFGSGTGNVKSNDNSINCGPTCSTSYSYNTLVTLSAEPDSNSQFFGWFGACTNSAGTCPVIMTQAQSVTAAFASKNRNIALAGATPVSYNAPGSLSWTSNNMASNSCTLSAVPNLPGYPQSNLPVSASNYQTPALTQDTTFTITCREIQGTSGNSNASFTAAVLPQQPSVSAAPSSSCGGNISLSYTGSANAASYTLYRQIDGDNSPYVFLETASAVGGLRSTDSGLTVGHTYFYQVMATNQNGASYSLRPVSTSPSGPCGRPTVSASTAPSCGGAVNLSYGGVSGAASYQLQRSLSAPDSGFSNLGQSQQGVARLQTTDMPPISSGATAYYQLIATMNDGSLNSSASSSASPSLLCINPPTNVSATAICSSPSTANGSVTLTWSAPTSGATPTGYNIYDNNLSPKAVAASPYTTQSNLSAGSSHSYQITSVNLTQESNPASATPSPTVIPTCAAPFDYSLSNGGNLSVIAGNSINNTVTATLTAGATQAVTPSIGALPNGMTASFAPASANPNPTATFTLTLTTTLGSTLPSTYLITVNASPSDPTASDNTTSFNLTVTNPLQVSCSASPAIVDLANNQRVTWRASASGGVSPYSYLWAGNNNPELAGKTGNPVVVTYTTTGFKSGQVTVMDSSGTQKFTDCYNGVSVTDSRQAPPVSDFSLIVSPPSVIPFSSLSSNRSEVSVFASNGFTGDVAVSVSPDQNKINGVQMSYDFYDHGTSKKDSTIKSANYSTGLDMIVTAAATIPKGAYPITITGTSGNGKNSVTHTATVNLYVGSAPSFQEF